MDFARRSAIVVASRSPIFFLRKPLEHSPCLRVMARRFLARRRRRDGRWFPVILLLVGMSFVVCAPAVHAQQEKQQAGDPRLQEAERLFQEGRAAAKARDFRKAIPLYEQALTLHEQALHGEDPRLLPLLDALGDAHRQLGTRLEAVRHYERALAIHEKARGAQQVETARRLAVIVQLYVSMGDPVNAVPLQERNLAIREKTLTPGNIEALIGLSETRYNMAMLYYMVGEQTRALALLETNLAIVEKLRAEAPVIARVGELLAATILHGMAAVYDLIGDYARALSLLEESLVIFEKSGGQDRAVARSLESMARQHWAMGDYSKALPLYQKSRSIYEQRLGPEAAPLANVLQNLAVLYQDMGEYATALPLYERSLSMTEKGAGPDHPAVAFILNNLAGLYLAVGEHQKAVALLQRALKIASDRNIDETLWRVQNGLRLSFSREGRSDLAVFFGKQAVNTIQSLRARLITLDPGLQRSFLGNKTDVYRGLADLLIDQGRLPEAQQVMAMLKEEEFFDFIRRDAKQDPRTTQTALTAQEEAWQKRYAEVSGRLAALGAEQEELRRKARLELSQAEQARRTQVEADLRVARLAFDQFLGALMKEVAQAGAARAAEVGERGLANLRALQGTLASLGHGAVTLHYLMGEEKLRILLTTPSVQIAREAKIGQRELNRKIEQFRRVLQNPRSNPLPIAQELYRLLLAPVAEDLRQAQTQTLMISLDGALRYIPFAALHDGKSYVIEQYRLAIFTEAAKDKLKDTPQASWRAAGLGLTREVEGFSPLPAVREELEGIIRAGDRGVLPGEVHIDQAFTASRMRDALDKAYPVLHVASHFVFQPGTESNSFLLLGDGNRLTLREMKENDFDFRNVDLITLSACETAVGGGRDANGQEIEGFGALVQKQGARGVIATLWPVADVSTGLLMQNLYRMRERQNLTKAEALRQAQLELIRGAAVGGADARRGAKRADAPTTGAPAATYAHPYFWAPFILMGNWL